ncbi:MAG: hypothetical protein WCA46_18470 [Actinocatenispora sp.]
MMAFIVPGDQVLIRGRRITVARAEWLSEFVVEVTAADGAVIQACIELVHRAPQEHAA